MMPGRDGWTVLAELKNDPDTRDIPIIVCSGYSELETILDEQGHRPTFFLQKPYALVTLKQAVGDILATRSINE